MNKCKECKEETKNPKFCSRSCSATYNNKGKVRNGKPAGNCKSCNKKLEKSTAKYCSRECQQDFWLDKRIESGNYSHRTAKRFLIKKHGLKCFSCKKSEWMQNPIPIELDHVDGNHQNNNIDNLRLLCPNCHALTSTYKNRNKGSGRAYRRIRYKDGKSY